MTARTVLCWSWVLLAALATPPGRGADGVAAQTPDPRHGIVEQLAAGDELAVETARRQLFRWPAERRPVELLRRILSHPDAFRAVAAASLLVQDGAATPADGARLSEHASARARRYAVCACDVPRLRTLVAKDPDDGVRVAAFWELCERGVAETDEALWLDALRADSDPLGDAGAELVVYRLAPFPTAALERIGTDARAVRRLLERLATRPRPGAVAFLRARLAAGFRATEERLWAYAALPPDQLTPDHAREMLAAAAGEGPDGRPARDAAARCFDRLPPALADRLVAEVHRLAVEGRPVDELLPALERVSENGERHLLALARALSDPQRAGIVDWLSIRGSAVLTEIVRDALARDAYPLTPQLVRLSGALIDAEGARERLLGMLEHRDAEFRLAAFSALIQSGRFEPALTAFALRDPDEAPGRMRLLLGLPRKQIPISAWRRWLAVDDDRVLELVIGHLDDAAVHREIETRLRALAGGAGVVAGYAATVCLARGREELATALWDGFDDDRRRQHVTALKARREDWAVSRVRAIRAEPEDFDVLYTRIHQGDRSALRLLLAEIDVWPVRWLRRCAKPASALLRAEDVAVVERLLLGPESCEDSGPRQALTEWLLRRPDLRVATILQRLIVDDPDEEVRYAALRGLLRDPRARTVYLQRVGASIGRPLSPDDEELCYEVLGALTPPLSAGELALLARLWLVAPLGDPRAEIEAHMDGADGRNLGDVAVLNLGWNLLRARLPDAAAARAAFAQAAVEARAHPHGHALGRRRLGRLLAILSRDEPTRSTIAPAVADLLLGAPDLDRTYEGPARLIQAEQAERDGQHDVAAARYRQALLAFLRASPPPLIRRAFLGDTYAAAGQLPLARLAAREHINRARALRAASRGEDDAARAAHAALALARDLAVGDDAAEQALRDLEQEMLR